MSIFKKIKDDIGMEEEDNKKGKAKKEEKSKKEKESEEEVETKENASEKNQNEKEENNKEEAESDVPSEEKEKKKEEEQEEEEKEKKKEKTKDWMESEGQLTVDVYQTTSEFCIQAPIAGISPEDLDIGVENEMLTIKGERRLPEDGENKDYFYQECYWGPFSRQIILPDDADTTRIKASLKNGILTVSIPRVTKIKRKKVSIKVE